MDIVVVIPTYNEADNISSLITAIKKLPLSNLHVLVVDDDSPDGTWKIVQRLEKKDKRVHLLHRTNNKGRGSAGIAGFKESLRLGADVVVEMDADFSHDPRYIPVLLAGLKHADMVLGSRALQKESDTDRPWYRQLLTKAANLYIRLLLGLPVKDCNSGYRAYRRPVLEAVDLDSFMAIGPDIVQEMLYKVHLKGFRINEVPIVFVERRKGSSKLGFRHLYKGYLVVLKLKILHLFGKF